MIENNFGRKLKELKRARSVGYQEISNATNIRRERLMALEENEAAPTDDERVALAEYYQIDPSKLGDSTAPARPQARPVTRPPLASNGEPRPARPQEPRYRDEEQAVRQPEFRGREPEPRRVPPRPAMPPRSMPDAGGSLGPERRSPSPQARSTTPPKRNLPPGRSSGQEALGDMEAGYLRKQQDTKTPLIFHFINGKTFTGIVTGYTPFAIIIKDEASGEEVVLRKLAIAYYEKKEGAPSA